MPTRRTNLRPTAALTEYLTQTRNGLLISLYNNGKGKLTKGELAWIFNITRQLVEHIIKNSTK